MKTDSLRLIPVIDTLYRLRSVRPVGAVSETAADTTALHQALTANPAHFAARTALADRAAAAGAVETACQLRWEGARLVCDLLEAAAERTDGGPVTLDWEDAYTAQALLMVYDSAEDHFQISDFELATALLESVIDADPEDHTNASELLAFCYAALEEWELFDETLAQLPPDNLSTRLAGYWAAFRRQAAPSSAASESAAAKEADLRSSIQAESPALLSEWTATDHETPLTPSPHSSARSEARRLWHRTAPLWRDFPEFVAFLQA